MGGSLRSVHVLGFDCNVVPSLGAGPLQPLPYRTANRRMAARFKQRFRTCIRADTAIDAALCSVPLPDGLLLRLDKFVYAMTDETNGSVDWLGC